MRELINHIPEASYVFVDTEGTGLFPRVDVPLEVGVTVADRWLNPLATNSWLVKPEGWEEKFAGAADIVRTMHVESGLIADLHALPEEYSFQHHRLGNQIGDYRTAFVSFSIWEWLTEICGLEAGQFPMAGSSIGSYDRPMWKEHFPAAEAFFSYRNIDVSSIKEVCRRANPGLFAQMQAMPEFQKSNVKHRVRDDIKASMRELDFYYNEFLVVNIPEEIPGQGVFHGLLDF